MLENGTDYTATTGTSVVLASGAATSDELNVIAFKSFTTADMVSSANGGTFYNNIDVQGTVTADGLTVDGDANLSGTAVNFDLDETDTTDLNTRFRQSAGQLFLQTANDAKSVGYNRLNINHSTGDISFYDTSGNAKFVWDASAESLGIGTSSPSGSGLHIRKDTSATTNELLRLSNSSGSTTDGVKLVMEVANTSGNGGEIGTVRDGGSFNPYMYFSTSAGVGSAPIERMRIDSNGRVAIGGTTVTDVNMLNIQGSGASSNIGVVLNDTNTSKVYGIQNGGSSLKFFDYSASATRMVIDSSGNVMIGTTTAGVSGGGEQLTVDNASGNAGISIRSNGTGNGNIYFSDNTTGTGQYAGNLRYDHNTNAMMFNTNSSERMRIDSSGSLLVGKTTTSFSTEGALVKAGGHFVKDGNSALYLSRRSSDGSILALYKDSTEVGSIGVTSSRMYAGTGDTGLFFNDQLDSIDPWNTSTNAARDAAIDLGDSSRRFKDLHLSGGVYLGGTGAANKLDDYEEGTYNVTMVPQYGTITMNSARDLAKYVKIGSLVHVSGQVRLSSVSGASGSHVTFSLPFANSSGSELSSHHWSPVSVYAFGYTNRDQGLWLFNSDSSARFLDSNYNYVPPSAFSGDEEIIFSFTYRTDA